MFILGLLGLIVKSAFVVLATGYLFLALFALLLILIAFFIMALFT